MISTCGQTAPSSLSEFGVPCVSPSLIGQHYRSRCVHHQESGRPWHKCMYHSIEQSFCTERASNYEVTRYGASPACDTIYLPVLMRKEPDARLGHAHTFIPSTL